MIINKILVPIYDTFIYVVIFEEKEYKDVINLVDLNDKNAGGDREYPDFNKFEGLAYERLHCNGHLDYWVFVPLVKYKDGKYKKISISTISHECFHITRMIAHSTQVLYDANNDEAFAYLNGYINQQVYDAIPKKMIKSDPYRAYKIMSNRIKYTKNDKLNKKIF